MGGGQAGIILSHPPSGRAMPRSTYADKRPAGRPLVLSLYLSKHLPKPRRAWSCRCVSPFNAPLSLTNTQGNTHVRLGGTQKARHHTPPLFSWRSLHCPQTHGHLSLFSVHRRHRRPPSGPTLTKTLPTAHRSLEAFFAQPARANPTPLTPPQHAMLHPHHPSKRCAPAA